jgi:rod shape determining protein RodA
MEKLDRLKNIPIFPLFIVVIVSIFSIIVLHSTSAGGSFSRCSKQIVWILLGLVILVITCLIDVNFWRKTAEIFYAACLILLMAVVVIGKVAMGAQRWLNFYVFNLQPSELMRLFLIIILSKYYSSLTVEHIQKTSSLLIPTLMTCAPMILVLIEPDLGTAMILLCVSLSIIFVAGTQIWKLVTVAIAGLSTTPIIWSMLHEYQRNRVLMLFSPELDPNGAGYHIIQSQIAIGSGGFWGKGLAGGTQCQLNFLPEKQTDFVFAALAEELGFIGCTALILLYALLLNYNMGVSFRAKHKFEQLLVFGLNSMMFFYIFINISMICGILPVVGIPLPFFSYGGSALTALMFCEGLIFSVDIQQRMKSKNALNSI